MLLSSVKLSSSRKSTDVNLNKNSVDLGFNVDKKTLKKPAQTMLLQENNETSEASEHDAGNVKRAIPSVFNKFAQDAPSRDGLQNSQPHSIFYVAESSHGGTTAKFEEDFNSAEQKQEQQFTSQL